MLTFIFFWENFLVLFLLLFFLVIIIFENFDFLFSGFFFMIILLLLFLSLFIFPRISFPYFCSKNLEFLVSTFLKLFIFFSSSFINFLYFWLFWLKGVRLFDLIPNLNLCGSFLKPKFDLEFNKRTFEEEFKSFLLEYNIRLLLLFLLTLFLSELSEEDLEFGLLFLVFITLL